MSKWYVNPSGDLQINKDLISAIHKLGDDKVIVDLPGRTYTLNAKEEGKSQEELIKELKNEE